MKILSSWWFVPAVALVVIGLLVHAWNGERTARGAAERAAEAAELEAKGVKRAAEATEAQLRARLAEAIGQVEGLGAEVERIKKAAPGARPVSVWTGTTGSVVVGGIPRPGNWPCSPAAPCPSNEAEKSATPAEPAETARNTPRNIPECVLAVGDRAEIRAGGATLETVKGNQLPVAVATAYRTWPLPETKIFGNRLVLDVSVAPPARPLGWGVGLMATAGRSGWAAGPALSPPPWVVLGVQLEALAGAGVGPTGDWFANAAVLARRSSP